MMNDSQDGPISNQRQSWSTKKLNGKLRPSWITENTMDGASSLLSRKITQRARTAENPLKDWNMRRKWYRHGGWITWLARNSKSTEVELPSDFHRLRQASPNTWTKGLLIKGFGILTWKKTTIAAVTGAPYREVNSKVATTPNSK